MRKKNIQIYKLWCMPVSVHFPFRNPKSIWKYVQVDRPRVSPSPHPHSAINSQCKAPHECKYMEMSSGSKVLSNESRQQTDRRKITFFSDTVNKLFAGEVNNVKNMLLILFTLSSRSTRTGILVHPSALCVCGSTVFVCLQRSDRLIHLPKWSQQSVIPLVLYYHL